MKPINTETLARDHDIIDNVHGLVASTGGVGVDEGLLPGDNPAEGLDVVLGLLGDGPHADLAQVVVSAVLWVGELLLKIFSRIE